MGERVVSLTYDPQEKSWFVLSVDHDGKRRQVTCKHVISSAPLHSLISMVSPSASAVALAAARNLKYRDFITVAVILKDKGKFDDNWLYIHDPSVKVGQIQNFKSWSPEMVPDPQLTCYGLEYFCFEGDEFWSKSEDQLVALAMDELVRLGLAEACDIQDGCVVRQPKAYPVYDDGYAGQIQAVRDESMRLIPIFMSWAATACINTIIRIMP